MVDEFVNTHMGNNAMPITAPTPTVKSGFWSDAYTFTKGISPLRDAFKRFARNETSKEVKEILNAAIAASTGEATVSTHKAIESATGNDLGGKRTVETINDMASATITAAQNASVLEEVTYDPAPTYPGDASGNGK